MADLNQVVVEHPPRPDHLAGKTFEINMGPQHPATHGVLRLVLELDGEVVTRCTPHLGYLHRGVEKIGEHKTFLQFIPYTDRLDYLAPLSSNVGYILAVEKLMDIEVPERCRLLRVMACEVARISAHLLWLGTHAIDLGAVTVFFHTFRERETLYDLIELMTGTRLTTSYTRVGGLSRDLPDAFMPRLKEWTRGFLPKVDEFERLLTRNRIWVDRTRGIGIISRDQAIALGLTGPSLRASGVPHDLRKAEPYCGYEQFDFEVPYADDGDVYARYMVRIEEMRQSARILEQATARLRPGPIWADHPKVVPPVKRDVLTNMDELIHHFMIVAEGMNPPVGEVYHAVEAPKGELGFYIVGDGTPNPHRCRVRATSFMNLQVVPILAKDQLIADLVAIIGTTDIVLGEVDR